MKKGFTIIVLVAVIGFLLIVGTAGYVTAKNFTNTNKPRKFDFVSQDSAKTTPTPKPSVFASPDSILNIEATPVVTSQSTGTVYKNPLGKYSITLPLGWSIGTTNTVSNYTTTKFTSTNGSISITYGVGNPVGGCSDVTNITLADRIINACLLLQKDGSQLLTRGYTKDKVGLDFTIEAYINPTIIVNRPVILNVIKTIDIS